MRITYIGHATLLLEIGGKVILTDPNFDPALGRFLERVSAPGIALAELPKLDMILLTHAHADHLSFKSLAAIEAVPLYAPPAVARWIKRRGVRHAIELGPGESVSTGNVVVHTAAATHAGNRYGVDRWRSQANMYLINTKSESVLFAGDTALTPDSTRLAEQWLRGRRLDVALLPIGYAPRWKVGFRNGHLTSMDALTLFKRLDARHLVPYHWGTFNHVTASAYDAIDELRATQRLMRAGATCGSWSQASRCSCRNDVVMGGDTIVATATAHGRGAIAIVRMSGPDAASIAARHIAPWPLEPRHATLCRVTDGEGAVLDDAIVTVYVAPASFTGEDAVEIATHGGNVVPSLVMARWCDRSPDGDARRVQPARAHERQDRSHRGRGDRRSHRCDSRARIGWPSGNWMAGCRDE